MRWTTLVVLDTDLTAVTARLGRLGVLQLFDVRALGSWADRLSWEQAGVLARAYDTIWRRLTGLLEVLGLSVGGGPEPGEVVRIDPETVLAESEASLAPTAEAADRLAERRRSAEAELARLDVVARELDLLRPLGVDLSELRRFQYLALVSGLVPAVNLERLRGSLERVPHTIVPISRVGDRVLILAFTANWHRDVLDRALRSAFVETVEIPADMTGRPADALRDVADRRANVERELARVTADLATLGNTHGAELRRIRDEVLANRLVVDAWQHVGQTEHTRILTGWTPAPQADELRTGVGAATGGRALVELAPSQPQTKPEVEHWDGSPGGIEPPVELRNPRFLRPFESLVTTYSLPRYDELDPTPLATALFLVMFGVMFGDLGQGAVLALIGVLIARRIIPFGGRTVGVILTAAGVSAMAFGLLFGSAFGSEALFPALWFNPFQNTTFFLEVAVGFGVAVLTVGILLHILNAWRGGDYRSLLLDDYGFVGLWLYLGLLLVVGLIALSRPVTPVALAGLVAAPILLLYFREPLAQRLGLVSAHEAPEVIEPTYYIESGVEVFDTLIRFVSNTVSFLRLAAFALAHAGLGIVVFTLAAMLSGAPVASLLVIVLGNIIIIALEGLIVSIQALRLQYYEFFSKFYRGGGEPFRPFAIPMATSQPGVGHVAVSRQTVGTSSSRRPE